MNIFSKNTENESEEWVNNMNILYKDRDFLVIDKPSGVIVHGDGKSDSATVVDWFLTKYPDARGVGEQSTDKKGEPIERSGVVHRLDRETSGVLVLAKNQKAFVYLKKQFQNREVVKTYRAFVYGNVKEEKGIIDRPIGRSAKDFRLRSAQRGARGTLREAVTEYIMLKSNDKYSYLELYPKTGRTHQIRTHLKAINHPVMCDRLYAPKQECALGFDRLALHAYRIELQDVEGKTLTVEAPLPDSFVEAEKAL